MNFDSLRNINLAISNISDRSLVNYVTDGLTNAFSVPYFYCFLINLEIDLVINSLPISLVTDAFSRFRIDSSHDLDNLKTNIRTTFGELQLHSNYKVELESKHQFYVIADEFVYEYYPEIVELEDFLADSSSYLNMIKGRYDKLRMPLRHRSGVPFQMNTWITPSDMCSVAIARKISVETEATIINEELGLGWRKISDAGFNESVYVIRIVYPAGSRIKCYKPTSLDGCIFIRGEFGFFANSKPLPTIPPPDACYGCTININTLVDGLYELVHAPIETLSNDFVIQFAGKARYECNVDRNNMLKILIARLEECRPV